MKDIDFDELDKAVNSLMSSVDQSQDNSSADSPQPNGSTPQDAPQASVPAVAAPSTAPALAVATPAAVSAAPPAAAPARSAAPAVRRTGRFMDMVNTSSSKVSPAPAAPSREGLSITPRQVQDNPAPAAPEPSSEPAPTPTHGNMPDPLDVAASAAASEPAPTGPTVALPAETAPIESPFLSDAKVEKRPLNPGTSIDAHEEPQAGPSSEPVTEESDLSSESTDSQPPAKTQDDPLANPQVPELASELVAIESTEKIETTQATETVEAASQVDEPSVPLGASSIAQQYKTAPSTGDQSHAAIYDASQYPQPVAHPAKHRSSWWWVLWVVLLLGAGAGGAILMYNLGIIP